MLFRCLGMRSGKANCGSLRRRASTQFADVRLERLEDRFLLSDSTVSGLSDPKTRPDLSSPTETDRSAQAPGPVSRGNPHVNTTPGATDDLAQSGVSNADDEQPTSGQQQPAASSSTDKQQGGNDTDSSNVPGPTEQNGSSAPGSGTTGSSFSQPCALDSAGYISSPGSVIATTSAPSTISLPSGVPSVPPSTSLPLPIPPGVPAGGIFKQVAAHSTIANLSVLSLDPVAVDLSTSSSASIASTGVTGAVHGGQPASLAAQSATNTLGFGFLKRSLRSWSNSSPRLIPIETAAQIARPRAELPDVTALAAQGVPKNPDSEVFEDANPRPSIDSMTEPMKTQELATREASSIAVNRIDPGEAETALKEKRISVNLAIYSAASLVVGVSAPGLTSVIRRGKVKARRRLPGVPGGRPPGSAG
jgi:hypothetical protein